MTDDSSARPDQRQGDADNTESFLIQSVTGKLWDFHNLLQYIPNTHQGRNWVIIRGGGTKRSGL